MLFRSNRLPNNLSSVRSTRARCQSRAFNGHLDRRVRIENWFLFACLSSIIVLAMTPECSSLHASDSLDAPASSSEATQSSLRLRLKNGGFTTGKLLPSRKAGYLRWQANGFAEPFEFELNSIRSAALITTLEDEPDFANQTRLLLADGTSLSGKLEALGETTVQLQSDTLGNLSIDRSKVRSLSDASYSGKLIYNGPVQKNQWIIANNKDKWSLKDGTLSTNTPDSVAVGEVGIPAKARIAIALSWQGSPDFVISFATTASNRVSKADQVPAAARLEVWDKQLALVREVTGGADISIVSELADGNQRIELTLYIDQESGQVIVCDVYGRPLGSVSVQSKRKILRSSIHLLNYGQSLALEALEVREWDGQQNASIDSEDVCVIDSTGKRTAGGVVGFNSAQQTVTVQAYGTEELLQLPLQGLRRADLRLPQSASGLEDSRESKDVTDSSDQSDSDDTSTSGQDDSTSSVLQAAGNGESQEFDDNTPPTIQIILKNQARIIGNLLPSEGEVLNFGVIGIRTKEGENLRIRPQDICGIVGSELRYSFPTVEERLGTIQLAGTQLSGFLTPSSSTVTNGPNAAPLSWQPLGSSTTSALSPNSSGVVVYRKPLPKVKSTRDANRTRMLNILLEGRRKATKVDKPDPILAGREILFRTGDSIAGIVERITDEGMYFASSQTKNKFARHAQIQSIELNPLLSSSNFDKKLMERLKTIPRNKKSDPPTHLFESINGDLLRGRLVALSNAKVDVEIRGEVQELDASKIAQIIWLHDRNWEEPEAGALTTGVEQPFMIHAISEGDRGLTFAPTELGDGRLIGNSELLGSCSTRIEELNQLLFGKNIVDRVREFNEDPWVLSLAQMPRVYLESDEEGSPATGTSSELIGKPAPGFDLESLSGNRVVLEQLRGRVVVLDFWASWCGPCMQSMPAVEDVVEQFGERVVLVPVNIQEDAERVSAAVKRLSLSTNVALDATGKVAADYQANAIPQTVIVDRNGIVQHVFVGGGKRVLASIQAALSSAVEAAE